MSSIAVLLHGLQHRSTAMQHALQCMQSSNFTFFADIPLQLQDHEHSKLSNPGPAMNMAGTQSSHATTSTTVLQTPLDMDSLHHQNQEKLNMLQV
jgi:hypothetical protein